MFEFETDCVHSTAEKINAMVDSSRQITWRTFRANVPVSLVRDVFSFYSYHQEKYNPVMGELTAPMHIKDDRCVGFHSGHYDGRKCYYITHSGIEYIFTEG